MNMQKYNKGYVDIHAHLLPVQDGPESYEEALDALRLAADSGIASMILTPHYYANDIRYEKAAILKAYYQLQQLIVRAQIPIKIYLGNELNIDRNVIASLKHQKAMTLANTRYILAEYPFNQVPCNYTGIIYELMSQGYKPIIAHPERNAYIHSGDDTILELKNMGCLIQINAASLLGDYGSSAMKYAQKLLKEGLVDFIASDAHSYVKRPPDVIHRCLRKLQMLSQDYMDSLLSGMAQKTIFMENNRLIKEMN